MAKPEARNRSLKCNSLLHAFQSIQTPVAVLVDADAIVDEHWLADLVAPLASSEVVASSANRWFLPAAHELGSNVRHFWNLAAAPEASTVETIVAAPEASTVETCNLRISDIY